MAHAGAQVLLPRPYRMHLDTQRPLRLQDRRQRPTRDVLAHERDGQLRKPQPADRCGQHGFAVAESVRRRRRESLFRPAVADEPDQRWPLDGTDDATVGAHIGQLRDTPSCAAASDTLPPQACKVF